MVAIGGHTHGILDNFLKILILFIMATPYMTKAKRLSFLPYWVCEDPMRDVYTYNLSATTYTGTGTVTRTLQKNEFMIHCSTATITLPLSPDEGECHIIVQYGSGLTINPNGKNMYHAGTKYTTSTKFTSNNCVMFLGYNVGAWYLTMYRPR